MQYFVHPNRRTVHDRIAETIDGEATVSQPASGGPITARFRLATHSPAQPFIKVRLVIEGGRMRPQESHGSVPIEHRKIESLRK